MGLHIIAFLSSLPNLFEVIQAIFQSKFSEFFSKSIHSSDLIEIFVPDFIFQCFLLKVSNQLFQNKVPDIKDFYLAA
jgi:hypothetical protein